MRNTIVKVSAAAIFSLLIGAGYEYIRYSNNSPLLAVTNHLRLSAVHAQGAPQFTVTFAETVTAGPGWTDSGLASPPPNNQVVSQRIHARREDGSMAVWWTSYGVTDVSHPETFVDVWDVPNKLYIRGAVQAALKTTLPMDERQLSSLMVYPTAESHCTSNGVNAEPLGTYLGDTTLAGFRGVLIRQKRGTTVTELPDFACILGSWSLKSTSQVSGRLEQTSQTVITSAVSGPPSPSLFVLNGAEVMPSVFGQKLSLARGGTAIQADTSAAREAKFDVKWKAFHKSN